MMCALCNSDSCKQYAHYNQRHFYKCSRCELVSIPENERMDFEKERARYALHDNTRENTDYRDYLNSFAAYLQKIPVAHPRILDFGSGPERVLENILSEKSIDCASYDPLFEIGSHALQRTYDIVVLCEVVEHMRDVGRELGRIRNLLNPHGYVLMRTELYDSHTDFESWWYAKDITHIHFFRLTTLLSVADILQKGITFTNAKNVAVFG